MAGIGRPQKFFDTLAGLGAELVATRSFADHHPYRDAEIAALIAAAEAGEAGMSAFKAAWRELIGLFIDDGSFALAILGWLLGDVIAIRYGLDPVIGGALLFVGLAVLLVDTVWRKTKTVSRARRRRG